VSAYNTTKPAFFKEIINFEIADVLRWGLVLSINQENYITASTAVWAWYWSLWNWITGCCKPRCTGGRMIRIWTAVSCQYGQFLPTYFIVCEGGISFFCFQGRVLILFELGTSLSGQVWTSSIMFLIIFI
jgi:hypothetical protein